jgi:hypothetical protein
MHGEWFMLDVNNKEVLLESRSKQLTGKLILSDSKREIFED